MTKHVDYYVALNSPWSYMGGARLGEIVRETGASISVRPVNLGVLLENTGGLPLPKRAPERQAYRLAELARWSDHLGIPINVQPAHFPSDENRAGRVVAAADSLGLDALALATRLGKALWEEEKSLADEAVIRQAAEDCDLDAEALLAAADDDTTAAMIDENTQAAIAAQVFGVPSYVVDGAVFWGQDRLDFVARLLAG